MRIRKYVLYLILMILAGFCTVFWMIGNCVNIREKTKTENPVTELEIWYPWTDKNELYEKAFLEVVAEYNQMHKEIQLVPYGMEMELYREKLPTDIASNDTPDMYYCFSGAYMEEIVRSGRILELDAYLNSYLEQISDECDKTLLNEMLEEPQSVLAEWLFDGRIYGLGFATTTGVFLVNEELFERYRLEIPETTDQLITVCREFLDRGIVPLACSEDNDVGFRMYLEALCMGAAGSENCISIMTGKECLNDAYKTGVQQFCELLAMGAFGAVPVQKNTHEVENDFLLSRIPMYYTKNSFIGNIMQKNNPLYGKIRVVAFPGTEGKVLLNGLCDGFVVNAETEYPQECTQALWAITKSLSDKLHDSGSANSIGRKSDHIPDDILQDTEGNKAYLDMMQLIQNAKEYMPFWETVINRKQMKRYMEASRKLFEQEIDTGEFVKMITAM